MSGITAAMVKELRGKTGAGMMDCKNALRENDGDMEAAVDWLRTKGLAKAAKKASRIAAEGLVAVAANGLAGALVEVNSETDFVARNEQFQNMASTIAGVALETGGDLDTLKKAPFPGSGKSVEDTVTDMVASIGENMSVRRVAFNAVNDGVVAQYVHNKIADGLGKIGVLVALESTGDKGELAAIGRQLAMHVAAANPVALNSEDIPADVIARERAVYAEQARESGKPEAIIEKMVDGRMRKFFEEAALLSQTYVVDGETKIANVVAQAAANVGAPVAITGFSRMELGEGIEKAKEDFAAEVAKAGAVDPDK